MKMPVEQRWQFELQRKTNDDLICQGAQSTHETWKLNRLKMSSGQNTSTDQPLLLLPPTISSLSFYKRWSALTFSIDHN